MFGVGLVDLSRSCSLWWTPTHSNVKRSGGQRRYVFYNSSVEKWTELNTEQYQNQNHPGPPTGIHL